jgi:branched-chain amino acid transport system substrate-binding protein
MKTVSAIAALLFAGQVFAQAKEIRIAHVYDKTGPLEAYAKQTHAG